VIALTGTPGTGKTEVASVLEKRGYSVLRIQEFVREQKLWEGRDEKRNCLIVDPEKISDRIEELGLRFDIAECHLSHYLRGVRGVAVLRCDPEVLKKRLEKRGWNPEKVRENVECEIIGLIAWEAREMHDRVIEIDTTEKTPEETAREVERFIKYIFSGRE